jgi:hypothetical protein
MLFLFNLIEKLVSILFLFWLFVGTNLLFLMLCSKGVKVISVAWSSLKHFGPLANHEYGHGIWSDKTFLKFILFAIKL